MHSQVVLWKKAGNKDGLCIQESGQKVKTSRKNIVPMMVAMVGITGAFVNPALALSEQSPPDESAQGAAANKQQWNWGVLSKAGDEQQGQYNYNVVQSEKDVKYEVRPTSPNIKAYLADAISRGVVDSDWGTHSYYYHRYPDKSVFDGNENGIFVPAGAGWVGSATKNENYEYPTMKYRDAFTVFSNLKKFKEIVGLGKVYPFHGYALNKEGKVVTLLELDKDDPRSMVPGASGKIPDSSADNGVTYIVGKFPSLNEDELKELPRFRNKDGSLDPGEKPYIDSYGVSWFNWYDREVQLDSPSCNQRVKPEGDIEYPSDWIDVDAEKVGYVDLRDDSLPMDGKIGADERTIMRGYLGLASPTGVCIASTEEEPTPPPVVTTTPTEPTEPTEKTTPTTKETTPTVETSSTPTTSTETPSTSAEPKKTPSTTSSTAPRESTSTTSKQSPTPKKKSFSGRRDSHPAASSSGTAIGTGGWNPDNTSKKGSYPVVNTGGSSNSSFFYKLKKMIF